MQEKVQLALISSLAVFLRCCVTYHSYSGEGKPPMYGDYEAQRHWQEITLNLPIDKWYINGTNNDLQYWGLDYPPLTAYHSLLLGRVANSIDPSFVELNKSRGYESAEHKYFMRLTVLIADVLIYIPAIICFVINLDSYRDCQINDVNIFKFTSRDIVLLTALLYPGLILIDHGHFQYNCVSLGLFVIAVTALIQDSMIAGSILFVLALNYKQMELYHALPIFSYILGSQLLNKRKPLFHVVYTLACVSLTVLLTFYVIWMPFLKNVHLFHSTLSRSFPFNRGIFEDKVANVWCTINVIVKLHKIFTNGHLAIISFLTTLFAVILSCVHLFLVITKNAFILSLINCALGFYLFSYQVHEKSILLVAVPVVLYFHNDPFPCFWFLIISHFSMLPLFIKDGLYTAYIGTMAFYLLFVFWMWPNILKNDQIDDLLNKDESRIEKSQQNKENELLSHLKKHFFLFIHHLRSWPVAFYGSMLGVLLLSIICKFVKPPEVYPDLFPVLISVYSCGHFVFFFLYFYYVQLVIEAQECTEKVKMY